MSVRWKNAVGILLILVVVASIVAGVTIAVLDNQKKTSDVEYFLDVAPVDYSADENVIAVKKFRDTIGGLISSYQQADLNEFSARVLTAASAARIPAYKLDGIATAIRRLSVGDWATDILSMDEEALAKIAEKSSVVIFRDFLADALEQTGLTTVEIGEFLYQYQSRYGVESYKTALSSMGKDRFVDLLGSLAYIIRQSKEISGSKKTDASVVYAAFYEFGEILSDAFSCGNDVFSTVLSLRFDSISAEVSERTQLFDNKTGYLFALIGSVFSHLSYATTENLVSGRFSEEVSYVTLAKDVKSGMDAFIQTYGENAGAENYAELSAQLVQYEQNILYAYALASNIDPEGEETQAYLYERYLSSLSFYDALEKMTDGQEYSAAEITQQISDFSAYSLDLEKIGEAFIYLWTVQRFGELNGEAS